MRIILVYSSVDGGAGENDCFEIVGCCIDLQKVKIGIAIFH